MTRNTRTILTLTAMTCAIVAHAQQGQTTGAVIGTVKTKQGAALGGATVTLRNKETGFSRNVVTTPQGDYRFSLLPPGPYEVTATAAEYKPQKDANVYVNLGQVTTIAFELVKLEVAGATVEVVSAAQALDTQQMNSVATISQDLVESIPLINRNFQDIAKLTPGVVQGNFNRLVSEGGRQIFNAVQIDGANNNSAFFGEQRGGSFIPFTFGADTIKELQVITNGFDAQYGQAGATVNAISKNGTNEFEGSVLYEMRKSNWAALRKPVPYDPTGTRNTLANRTRINDSYNVNFNVSGPIFKDKLFYFAGVERFNKKVDVVPVLTGYNAATDATEYPIFLNSRLGRVVASKRGLTIGQEMGDPTTGVLPAGYNMEATNTVYFTRLDWTASPNHRFVFRVNYTVMDDNLLNTSSSQINAESNFILDKISALSWVAEANNIWTPTLFTESRLQISSERRPMRGNAVEGTPQVSIGGGMATGTKTSTPRESNEFITQFFSQTTWNSGDWTVKGGLDYFKADELNQFFQNNAGRFQFSTFAIANAWSTGTIGSTPSGTITYDGAISPTFGRINMWTSFNALFLQTAYTGLLNRRLNLQFGLRYNKQEFSKNDKPNPNFAGLDQAVGNSSLDPRFSFTFDVDGKGKTLIRGGYGQFSSPTPLLIHSNTMNNNGLYTANYRFSLPSSGRTSTQLTAFNTGILSANAMISGSTLQKASDANLVALATLFGSTGSGSTGALFDPDTKLTVAKKMSLGVEHDMGERLVVGFKASYVKYDNLQYYVNVNLNQGAVAAPGTPQPYNDGYQPGLNTWSTSNRPGYAYIRGRRVNFAADPTIPGYPATGFGDVLLSKSDGYGHYRGLVFTLNKKWSDEAGLMANLTLSRAQDTGSMERATPTSGGSLNGFTSGLPNSEIGAAQMPFPGDPGSNYGLNWSDRLAVFNAVAYFPVAWGVNASVRFLYQTGLPYTAMDGRDTNGDGVANHPVTGRRNDQRQPDYNQIDLRLSRTFAVWKKVKIEAILDIYNVLNTAYNEIGLSGNTAGQVATTSSGAANAAFGKQSDFWEFSREVQLGIRLKF